MKIKFTIDIDSDDELITDGLLEALQDKAEDYLQKQNAGATIQVEVNEVEDPFRIF